jgi:RNA polymerase sigma-70 factor (ECF subfamily)
VRTRQTKGSDGELPELTEMVERACAAWPELALNREDFVQFAEQRLGVAGSANARPQDLYLAFGCSVGDAAAIAAFEKAYARDMEQVARRFESPQLSREDLRQLLREKLLVARDGCAPKIADFNGRGFLQNWLRVTAVRTFLDEIKRLKRHARERPEDGKVLEELADGLDPELEFLKRKYRGEFKTAFAAAIRTLSSEERNLLRHQALAGLNVDQIGAIYAVHRATAARRLDRARQALLKATRGELMRRLSVDRDELESIMQLILSNLDVSIHRVLLTQSISEGGSAAEPLEKTS